MKRGTVSFLSFLCIAGLCAFGYWGIFEGGWSRPPFSTIGDRSNPDLQRSGQEPAPAQTATPAIAKPEPPPAEVPRVVGDPTQSTDMRPEWVRDKCPNSTFWASLAGREAIDEYPPGLGGFSFRLENEDRLVIEPRSPADWPVKTGQMRKVAPDKWCN